VFDSVLSLVVFVSFFLCAGFAEPGSRRIAPEFAALQVHTFGACFAEQKLSPCLTHHASVLVVAVSPMVRKVWFFVWALLQRRPLRLIVLFALDIICVIIFVSFWTVALLDFLYCWRLLFSQCLSGLLNRFFGLLLLLFGFSCLHS
jgi:hypothetical protein